MVLVVSAGASTRRSRDLSSVIPIPSSEGVEGRAKGESLILG